MNWNRVLLGGLVAGVVLNIGEWLLNGVILADQMDATMEAMGGSAVTGSMIAGFVAIGFLMGILLVWLYAAIRPRFGPGPKTAILAGVAGWAFVSGLWYLNNLVTGLFPSGMMTTMLLWTVVETPLATVVGAWFYREQEAPAAAHAPA